MMLGTQIAALMPSVVMHLIVTVAFAGGVWFLLSKSKPDWKIDWHVPVILGAAFSLYNSSAAVIGLYQNQVLFTVQQQARAQQQPQDAAQQAAQNSAADPKLQMKAEFLKAVDGLTSSNDQLSPTVAQDLFSKFGGLFAQGESDRKNYADAVLGVYQCQQFFYEDALASYKSRKAIKSEERERCEKADGSFFNREKLIPAEMAKGNSEAIDLLAQRKPLLDASGKAVEVSEDSIRGKLEAQMHRIGAVKRLFANAGANMGGGPKPASVSR